jgi:hypothetical protein
MLDVHPPHHAANTLRDFLIHIVTIVIGLLIAIGLEQGVEMLHERHSIRESHEALQREYEENEQRLTHETQFWRRGAAALQNNLLILRYLQQHPQTPEDRLPGKLFWGLSNVVFAHAAWDSAQQTGIIKLFPQGEATETLFSIWNSNASKPPPRTSGWPSTTPNSSTFPTPTPPTSTRPNSPRSSTSPKRPSPNKFS